jgi:hypothetical protein
MSIVGVVLSSKRYPPSYTEVVFLIIRDYHSTFETTEAPDYVVALSDDGAVAMLQSKEWFEWQLTQSRCAQELH